MAHGESSPTPPRPAIDAAPADLLYRHFAFFSRLSGIWLGEIAGYVPYPDVPRRPRRRTALERWQLQAIRGLGTSYRVVDEVWSPGFARVPSERTVALDVTRFAWPVGDHVWHRWNDIERLLDWPEASGHRCIEIDTTTLEVVAHVRSHRPVRDAVPGQHVLDLTGTPYEALWGWVWGRFLRRGDSWGFEPRVIYRRNSIDALQTAPAPVRRQLQEAPIELDLVRASAGVWVPRRAMKQGTVSV